MSDQHAPPLANSIDQEALFSKITEDLRGEGFSINPSALPDSLAQALLREVSELRPDQFNPAGIGRDRQQVQNSGVRRDKILWINGETAASNEWLTWADKLQQYLNRRLYLGLFSFESHFAHYRAGDFYQRHQDAFKGKSNRVLSVVVYLNRDWRAESGGELMLYRDQEDLQGVAVVPNLATVVVFLSEDFPHEVLPSQCDRYSIAGWFRVNTSDSSRADPAQ